MRLTAHAAMSPRFTTRLRTRGSRPGLAKSQKASTIWNQPARANCRPSIVEASAWEPTMTRWMAPAATDSPASNERMLRLNSGWSVVDRDVP